MLNFNLDLQKQDNFSKAFTARQGDAGEQFSVTLFDNQVPYAPASGDVVSLRVVTPSGKFASVAGTISGNKATFTLNGQITSEAGYYQRAYVAVSNGTKLRTTQDLIFFSLGNSDINKGQADYYVAELDKLLQQLNEEFDEWLAEREQDYSDLLARIVTLTNSVTGLEQDVQDLIDAIQANRINTKNVFDSSLINQPESEVRRRFNGQTIDIRVWGAVLFNNEATIQMFEPNKTYHAKYIAELLTLTGGDTTLSGHFSMLIYSGKTGFPNVRIVTGIGGSIANVKVGDKIELENTFTTPTELYNPDANYQIVGYSRRDNNSVVDAVRFHDIMIQEGSIFTGYQNNPDNELTRYDKDRLKQNLHPDPMMTGTVPIVNKDIAIRTTFTTSGWVEVNNTDTAATRRFWYDPVNDLNMPAANVLRPLSVSLKVQLNNGASITVGYASGENIVYTSTSDTDWVWVTGIVKSSGSTGLSVYLSPNASLKIQQFDIYYAEITNSSNELNKLPAIEKVTVGTPDTLTGIDANTLFNSGVWKVTNGVNMPPNATNYYYLRVINFNPNNCIQFASLRLGSTGDTSGNYVRQCINGTWQEWRKIQTILPDDKADVSNGIDFNTIKNTGCLVSNTPVNAPTPTVGLTWYLETIAYGASNAMQRATMVNENNRTYTRQYVNSKWIDWQLEVKEGGLLTTRDQGTDLNDYVTSMQFMIFKPLNAPVTGDLIFYIEVLGYNTTSCKQRATIYGSANREFVRQKVNNIWTPWKEIAFV